MLNEVLEVKDYLEGQNINLKNLYRICYLMAKWHLQSGLSPLNTQEEIFAWGKRNSVHIKFSVHDVINKAADDKSKLKDNAIYVSKANIDTINRRFSSPSVKYAALAMLCYAKAHADRDREFTISAASLAAWMGVDRGNLQGKKISELVRYEYLSIVDPSKRSWNNMKADFSSTRYRLCIPAKNEGDYVLEDNDIRSFFNSLF